MLPYSKQKIELADIQAVIDVLNSDWLTTGPAVDRFEQSVCDFTGAAHAVAVSSGTAALHAALYSAGVGPGDEVIVPAITFVATANAVLYCGGTPVFADVNRDTLLVDPASVEFRINERTKAIIAMDYAGQPADYGRLREIATRHGLRLIADACHSIGGSQNGVPVGKLADLTCFSFHPVKPVTSAEGGMVLTEDGELAEKIGRFRNHGITTNFRQRADRGVHEYDMPEPGFNYRLSDLHAALGASQMQRLAERTRKRNELAAIYDQLFSGLNWFTPLKTLPANSHSRHLYVIRLNSERVQVSRDGFHAGLRERGIAANVHYRPVFMHTWYQENLPGSGTGCEQAQRAWTEILTLPLFPEMGAEDVVGVVNSLCEIALGNSDSGPARVVARQIA